ncbi:MAG: hypothetical protein ACRDNE_10410, partial [Gaiellaceae bacterium]
ATRPRPAAVALLLLAAAALVAGLVAAQLGRDGTNGAGANGDGDGGNGSTTVQLSAVADYDPDGDAVEHPEDVELATDGDPATYWRTETYSSFSKEGVGIVLAAAEPVALSRLVVLSGEPGYRAKIQAGSSESGPFEDVSSERTVGERTAFPLDTGGEEYGFYVVWITDLAGRATVSEVRARS